MKLQELFEERKPGDVEYLYGDKYKGKRYEGHFSVADMNLESLNGCPSEVVGQFVCANNKLTNLIGGPTEVKFINAYGNNLTSLSGAPSIIHRSGDFKENKLENLHNIHKEILEAEELWFQDNPIKSHILCLLKIRNLKIVYFDDKTLESIITKYLPRGNLLECQQELIDAGFEDFAQL